MAGPVDDPQLGRISGRLGQFASVFDRHDVVVRAVQDQQGSVAELAYIADRIEVGERPDPLLKIRWEVVVSDHPDSTRVGEKAHRIAHPFAKRVVRIQCRDATNSFVPGRRGDGKRTPHTRAHEPYADRFFEVGHMVDGRMDVVEPSVDREVAFGRAGAAVVERQGGPTRFARDSIRQLGIGRAGDRGATRTARETVAQHDRGRAPRTRRTREVRAQLQIPGGNVLVQATIILVAVGIPAFKEWAVIVQALLEGEQIVDVRKGGIREDGRHFELQATRFWLYPTVEHQRAELLKLAYRHWMDSAPGSRVGTPITVSGWADVVATATITDVKELEALDGKLIWTPEYAQSRLNWKHRDPLWILVLRVHRLDEPITVAWNETYGGCTSWVPLDGMPDDPALLGSTPALSDVAFEGKLKGVNDALSGGLEPVD